MRCPLGGFAEYARLRRAVSDREKELNRRASHARRADVARTLEALRIGDIIEIPTGRRSGFAVVLDPGRHAGLEGPRPTVLSTDRQVRRVTVADVGPGVRTVGSVRVPR